MDELSKEFVVTFFSNRLRHYGDRPEALAWSSGGQGERYRGLLDIDGSIDGSRVLDFGCGKGDFYRFLRERNIHVRYTGIDINEDLINLASEKYPECRFMKFDIDREDLDEEFDYIFLCGVFNLKVQGLKETIQVILKKLFQHCRVAMAFNALSSHNPHKAVELYYMPPEEIFSFAVKNLSPRVVLRHDRIPYDFTLFLYKDRHAYGQIK